MEKELVSSHKLTTKYSLASKLKGIVIGWLFFIVLFIITRLPSVQSGMVMFAKNVTVPWVTSTVNFIINGFWVLFIPMVIGTFTTLLEKKKFDSLNIYNTGIGFCDDDGIERYSDYSNITLHPGKYDSGFYVTAKESGIKETQYSWNEFSQYDVLKNNLKRYAKWGFHN